jgi:hypothetical protein
VFNIFLGVSYVEYVNEADFLDSVPCKRIYVLL